MNSKGKGIITAVIVVLIALAAFCGLAQVILQLAQHSFLETSNKAVQPTVANIGNQMLGTEDNGYALPFEVVSILLLAALIGCIVIALKSKPETT